jgi:hypothetical protein
LKKLDFLNRDQLQKLHRLGTKRNANKILQALSPYLSSFREEEQSTIYYLNSEGRDYVNSKKVRRKNKFVNHVIMRNDFYIYSGCPVEWKNEMKTGDSQTSVICDALFRINGIQHYLEIDHLQKMSENKKKISQYKALFEYGAIAKHFGHFPTIVWVTTTELRRKQLNELCKGLPCKVYTINDIR